MMPHRDHRSDYCYGELFGTHQFVGYVQKSHSSRWTNGKGYVNNRNHVLHHASCVSYKSCIERGETQLHYKEHCICNEVGAYITSELTLCRNSNLRAYCLPLLVPLRPAYAYPGQYTHKIRHRSASDQRRKLIWLGSNEHFLFDPTV